MQECLPLKKGKNRGIYRGVFERMSRTVEFCPKNAILLLGTGDIRGITGEFRAEPA
jgi:hypothetical protein